MSDASGKIEWSTEEAAARATLCQHARLLLQRGLSPGTSGNLSVRLGTQLLITPSGVPFDTLHAHDLVLMDFAGRYAHALAPSSEWALHRDLYVARPEIAAVVHAHPPSATALAITRRGIPPLHYMIVAAGGHDIRCSAYATFSTVALSHAVLQALEGRTACLMANHGMVAVAGDLPRALWLAGEVEVLAAQYLQVLQVGGGVLLTATELEAVREQFRDYGLRQPAPVAPPLLHPPVDS